MFDVSIPIHLMISLRTETCSFTRNWLQTGIIAFSILSVRNANESKIPKFRDEKNNNNTKTNSKANLLNLKLLKLHNLVAFDIEQTLQVCWITIAMCHFYFFFLYFGFVNAFLYSWRFWIRASHRMHLSVHFILLFSQLAYSKSLWVANSDIEHWNSK